MNPQANLQNGVVQVTALGQWNAALWIALRVVSLTLKPWWVNSPTMVLLISAEMKLGATEALLLALWLYVSSVRGLSWQSRSLVALG